MRESNIIVLNIELSRNNGYPSQGNAIDSKIHNVHCIECAKYQNCSFLVNNTVKFKSGVLYTSRGGVKLSCAACRTLRLFVRNMEVFLSKDEINKYVWGDRPSMDHDLNAVITELRSSLADTDLYIFNPRKSCYVFIEMVF